MDAERLSLVCETLFPDVDWRKGLAEYLAVNPTTVWRWIRADRVPLAVEIALEHSFNHGLYRAKELIRE